MLVLPISPSSKDVQTVTPGRDPGAGVSTSLSVPGVSVPRKRVPSTNVPSGAFEGPLTAVGDLAPGLERLAIAARRQEARDNMVDRADIEDRHFTGTADDLKHLNIESDLSKGDVLQGYGESLTQSTQALLDEHRENGGSLDSLAQLEVNLERINSQRTGEAAAISTRIGLEKVDKTIERRVDTFIQRARANPTKENTDGLLLEMEGNLSVQFNELDQNQRDTIIKNASERVALATIRTHVGRGRYDLAQSMIEEGLSVHLSDEAEQNVLDNLNQARNSRNQFSQKLTAAEIARGEAYTPEQTKTIVDGLIGLDASGGEIDINDTAKFAVDLLKEGMDPNGITQVLNQIAIDNPESADQINSIISMLPESQEQFRTNIAKADVAATQPKIEQLSGVVGEDLAILQATGASSELLPQTEKVGNQLIQITPNEDGTFSTEVIFAGEEDAGDITSGQRLAAGFAKRTTNSNLIISEIGDQFTGFESRAAGAVPQGLKSEDRQRFDQATRDFINATLRRESGAAIQQSEFDSANLQYIPQPGDSPEVLAQKKANREVISTSLELEAGGAFTELEEALPKTVLILGKPMTVGDIVENSKGQKGRIEQDGSITILK